MHVYGRMERNPRPLVEGRIRWSLRHKQRYYILQSLDISVLTNNLYESRQLCSTVSVPFTPNSAETNHIIAKCREPVFGNLLMIRKFGEELPNTLELCEVIVEASTDTVNLSFEKHTHENGIYKTSGLAVDGKKETCTTVLVSGNELAWWRVSLGYNYHITSVAIHFTPGAVESTTFEKFNVYVSSDPEGRVRHRCASFDYATSELFARGHLELKCRSHILANLVTVEKIGGNSAHKLFLCEVEVFSRAVSRDCKKDMPFCQNISSCVPKEEICDRVRQCPDGSDEMNCICQDYEYKCQKGPCIHEDWLCDGISDCPNGDDEDSLCKNWCDDGFKCKKRVMCIPNYRVCNGNMDCPDMSDEFDCFGFKNGFLVATYRGVPDFYVCSENWKTSYSRLICNEIYKMSTFESSSEKINDKVQNIITVTNEAINYATFGINYFWKSFSCKRNEFVKLTCIPITPSGGLCGRRQIPDNLAGPYMINGDVAKPGAWPWHAKIYIKGIYICGASLVKENWILTAAHCIQYITNPSDIVVELGTSLMDDPSATRMSITHIVKHPDFNEDRNDIALIRLGSFVTVSKFVGPVCLPFQVVTDKDLMSYSHCAATGFGNTDRVRTDPQFLMQGRMNLMSDDECFENMRRVGARPEAYYRAMLNDSGIVCAGSIPTTYGINFCLSDSGGPLVCRDKDGTWVQIGVVSFFSYGAAEEECTNNVFTRVHHYLSFIRAGINGREDCGGMRANYDDDLITLFLNCNQCKADIHACTRPSKVRGDISIVNRETHRVPYIAIELVLQEAWSFVTRHTSVHHF